MAATLWTRRRPPAAAAEARAEWARRTARRAAVGEIFDSEAGLKGDNKLQAWSNFWPWTPILTP